MVRVPYSQLHPIIVSWNLSLQSLVASKALRRYTDDLQWQNEPLRSPQPCMASIRGSWGPVLVEILSHGDLQTLLIPLITEPGREKGCVT